MLPTQAYYDNSITARPYDLNQARHYLQLAGYSPPTSNGVSTLNLQGILNDTTGAAEPNATITLLETTNNSTFPNSLTAVSHTTADINGFYSFVVNPTTAGTYYYYLQDTSVSPARYIYLQSFTATGTSSSLNLTEILEIVAVVIIIVIVVAVVGVVWRRRK